MGDADAVAVLMLLNMRYSCAVAMVPKLVEVVNSPLIRGHHSYLMDSSKRHVLYIHPFSYGRIMWCPKGGASIKLPRTVYPGQ